MQTSLSPRHWKRWHWLLAGALLALGGAGITVYATRPRANLPVPPGENLDGLEPAVREVLQGARSRVLADRVSGSAWGTLGEVFLANDLERESEECFREAERLDPTDPRWPYFQGGALLNQGDHEAALPFLRRAEELREAEESAPRLLLGETLLIVGHLDEAEAHFRQVLARKGDDPRALFNLGLLAVARQDWKGAHGFFLRCLGSPHARQKASAQLASVCRRLGDLPAAREYHAQAQRLPKDLDWPDSFVTGYMRWAVKKRNRYRLVERLEAAGRWSDAIAILQPMTEQYPDDYLPCLTLGKMLGRTGEYARAEVVLRKARKLAPDKVQCHYYLSLVLYMKGEALLREKETSARARPLFLESADLARQAIQLQADYGFAYMSLGLALKRLGQQSDAIAALRQAIRCNPELAEIHYYLGDTLAEQSQADEARARLEHALRLAEPQALWRQAATDRLRSLPRSGTKKRGSRADR